MEDRNTLLVLGNGPSLSVNLQRDHNILCNNPVLCVNGFALSPAYEEIRPAYYVLADGAFWSDNLPEKTRHFVHDTLEAITQKTQWPLTFLIPYEGCSAFKKKNILVNHPFVNIKPYNATVIKGFKRFNHLLLKLNLGMLSRQNVLIPSLILAVNMGYKRVILLGADHSWHQNLFLTDDNQVCLKDEHFYEEGKAPIPIMTGNRPSRLHEQFESMAKALRTYWEIADYIRNKNVDIINASEVSYVDAFSRAKLYNLF